MLTAHNGINWQHMAMYGINLYSAPKISRGVGCVPWVSWLFVCCPGERGRTRSPAPARRCPATVPRRTSGTAHPDHAHHAYGTLLPPVQIVHLGPYGLHSIWDHATKPAQPGGQVYGALRPVVSGASPVLWLPSGLSGGAPGAGPAPELSAGLGWLFGGRLLPATVRILAAPGPLRILPVVLDGLVVIGFVGGAAVPSVVYGQPRL